MPRPAHFEIPAENPERAIAFYTDVFGWTFQKWDGGPTPYWLITKNDGVPMFDPKAFYLSISSLLRNEQDEQAEQAMLAARAELTRTEGTFSFKHVQACQAQVNGDAQ